MSKWMDDWNDYNGWTNSKPPSKKSTSGNKSTSKKKSSAWKRCWEDHKPIKVLNGEVLGAACAYPQKGYDIYIGLDHGMEYQNKDWPWITEEEKVVEFLYPITDMCAPKSIKDFRRMIEWMAEQLEAGKKIQVGCIGGHGRTGLVLAALVAHLGIPSKNHGKWNAIQYVRKHHCSKGVESTSQVNFLVKHFKVTKVSGAKESYGGKGSYYSDGSKGGKKQGYHQPKHGGHIKCMKSSGRIW